jgi:hypothetical protein
VSCPCFHTFAQHTISSCRYRHELQRTRGRSIRSASATPSYSIITLVCCPPQHRSKARFRRFRYPTRSPRRACQRHGFAARSSCASTRSSVAIRLCAGNYSRRWSNCYMKTSLLAFPFAGVSQRLGVRLYILSHHVTLLMPCLTLIPFISDFHARSYPISLYCRDRCWHPQHQGV